MNQQVLVAYATKYGSTAAIAERIGEAIRHAGLNVDVLPVNQVRNLSGYTAVVLGSAVYVGRWRREAAAFLKANRKVLARQVVWVFSSGPTGKGDPMELLNGWRLPKALEPVADEIKPRNVTVFHGMLDASRLTAIERWMIGKVKAKIGDFRDWEAIAGWAEAIAGELQ